MHSTWSNLDNVANQDLIVQPNPRRLGLVVACNGFNGLIWPTPFNPVFPNTVGLGILNNQPLFLSWPLHGNLPSLGWYSMNAAGNVFCTIEIFGTVEEFGHGPVLLPGQRLAAQPAMQEAIRRAGAAQGQPGQPWRNSWYQRLNSAMLSGRK